MNEKSIFPQCNFLQYYNICGEIKVKRSTLFFKQKVNKKYSNNKMLLLKNTNALW